MSEQAQKQNLTPTLQMQEMLTQMEQMKAELDSLKGRTYARAQPHNQALPQPTVQAKPEISTTRRKLLRRLAGGLVAGLAVGGIGVSLPQNAEAKISSNPATNGLGNRAGMLVVPPGTSVINNLNGGSTKVGLVVSSDNPTFDISVFTPTVNAAILASTNNNGTAIVGQTVNGTGVYGQSNSGIGVSGSSTSGSGVYGITTSSSSYGLFGTGPNRGVQGIGTDASNSYGVYGIGRNGVGGEGTNAGVVGTGTIAGVSGTSDTLFGVKGTITSGTGVYGNSSSGYGVDGYSSSGDAVHGRSGSGRAGYFEGNVSITNNLSKGGGSFKIDHPLNQGDCKVSRDKRVERKDLSL